MIIAEKRDGRRDDHHFVFQLSSRFLNRGFDGLLGEVIVYDRPLDHTEVGELQQYLGAKWEIECVNRMRGRTRSCCVLM